VLSEGIEKALYLDCDVVVERDVGALCDLDPGGHYVLAAQDLAVPVVSSPMGLKLYKELGLDGSKKYLNAGVMLMNLKKWRDNGISKRVVAYIRENEESIQFCDQDGINAIIPGQWGEFDPRWNQMSQIYGLSSYRESPYDQERFEKLLRDPYIRHFSASAKPWNHQGSNRNMSRFFYYLKRTAFAHDLKRPFRATLFGRILDRSLRALR